jgi:hypothetical protein
MMYVLFSAYAELQRKTKMLKAAALIFGTSSFSMRGFAPHSFCTHGLKVALLTGFPRLLGFHLWSLALFVAPVTPVTLYLLKTGMIFRAESSFARVDATPRRY